MPAGIPAAIPGGIPAGKPAGIAAGIAAGIPACIPAGMQAGMPAGIPTGIQLVGVFVLNIGPPDAMLHPDAMLSDKKISGRRRQCYARMQRSDAYCIHYIVSICIHIVSKCLRC